MNRVVADIIAFENGCYEITAVPNNEYYQVYVRKNGTGSFEENCSSIEEAFAVVGKLVERKYHGTH